jgi:aryl-alcohol dehydrogenase-like predicted oxidoreductase
MGMTTVAVAGIPLVLGGNVFGWTADEDASFAVLDAFYEAGGRMVDTADVYSAWVPGHQGGESERVIGKWLESRGVRGEMQIHTKTGMRAPGGHDPALFKPEWVADSLARSLDHLRTDYVDLYYAHRDYEELPVADIIAAFGATVTGGKARAVGASNFTAQRLSAALDAAAVAGREPLSALQNEYNLVSRASKEGEVQDLVVARGLSAFPFYGLANGFLTGQYRTAADLGQSIRGARLGTLIETGQPMLAAMDAVAAESGATLAQIALAWIAAQPGIGAPIASATTVAQVEDLTGMAAVKLSEDQLARLTAAL